MPSPTELHFEGPSSTGTSRRWMLLAAVGVIALLAMFARATLPDQRSELIGKWQNISDPKGYYEFRRDGTYEAVVMEQWIAGNTKVHSKYSGRWRATADALYLTHSKIVSMSPLKSQKSYDSEMRQRIGHEIKTPVEWPAEDQWLMRYEVDQTYQKVATANRK